MHKLAAALKHACSWSIGVNDRRICYRTIPDEFALMREIGNDEFTVEVEAECVKTGEVWECRVYSETPVGHYHFVDASGEALEARVLRWAESYPWSMRPHLVP